LDNQDSTPNRGNEGIFLFATSSKLALKSTKPPIQRVLGALSLGVKQRENKADQSQECVTLHLHSSICLHGVVLNFARDVFFIVPYLIKHRDNITLLFPRLWCSQGVKTAETYIKLELEWTSLDFIVNKYNKYVQKGKTAFSSNTFCLYNILSILRKRK
jgi:hypothetical protein